MFTLAACFSTCSDWSRNWKEEGARHEARQRTGKLEAKPFLETLPVYRYRPEHRQTHGR
jgi:hypothetical protein